MSSSGINGDICALLFRRVGDSLLATPALRAIKKSFSESRLCVLTEPQVVRVFEGNPNIDEVIVTERSPSPLQLVRLMKRNGRPAITIDFLSDPRSALACLLTHAGTRIGFRTSMRSIFYTHRVSLQDEQHPVYSALHKLGLAKAAGANDESIETDFYLSDSDSEFANGLLARLRVRKPTQLIAIFPFSRRDYKRWEPDRYISLCRKLQAIPDFFPLLISGPGEAAYCASIATAAGFDEKHLIVFDDLGEMAATLKECSVYVGNDGGPKHLAAAMGTPTVTIFLNDPPEYWTPPDSFIHVVLSAMNGKDIAVETVLDEVHRVVGRCE